MLVFFTSGQTGEGSNSFALGQNLTSPGGPDASSLGVAAAVHVMQIFRWEPFLDGRKYWINIHKGCVEAGFWRIWRPSKGVEGKTKDAFYRWWSMQVCRGYLVVAVG